MGIWRKGGLGGIVSDAFGSTNDERAKGRQVDPNAYQYGGAPGGADEAANRYQQQGEDAQNRQATQAQKVDVNYGQANADRAQQQQARQGQNSLAQIMQNRATGGGPTIAQQQGALDANRAQAAQVSQAGSARGAAGLALANQNAASNIANAQAQISNSAQINSANERRDDTNAAAGMYSNMRGGDQNAQAQSAQQAQFRTQSGAQQNQFNAGLRDSQAGRNDQFQLGMTQNEQNVRNSQLTAGMNQQAQQSANDLGQQQINAQIAGQNAQMNQKNAEGVIGTVGNIAGGIAGLARGGPAAGGRPYLVGEEGPELIVPKKDGYVLTHEQTQRALGNSPADTITRLFNRGDQQTRGRHLADVLADREPEPRDRSPTDFLMALLGGPRREDGGPVVGGGAPSVEYVPPTWGVGPGLPRSAPGAAEWEAEKAVNDRMAGMRDLDQRAPTSTFAIPGFTPGAVGGSADEPLYRRDQELSSSARAKEAQGIDLSEREAYEAQGADYRLSKAKKGDRANAAKSGNEKPKKTLSDILGTMGKDAQQSAAGVDTAYHGGGGYIPPQLIPISGARALGGPISAGGLGKPLRPDEAMPMMGPGSGAGAASYEILSGGGENVGASGRAMSDVATKFGKHPGASPTSFGGAREDGGPVEGGPAPKGYETKLTPDEEKAFAAWKAKYAPQDSGEDYDYRGAYKAGAQPGEDGHWVDTFKKPNHPTFSTESQYARGDDAAKAGRWNGERFIPAKVWDGTRKQFVIVPTQAPREEAVPQPAQAAPKYNYDASKPFGERFVPAKVRQPVSFERTDQGKVRDAEASERAANINLKDAAQAAASYPTLAAAGPALAGGLGNFITSLWQRNQATRPMKVEDDEEQEKRRNARPSLVAVMGRK